ncbi:hypothetical protein GUJ93_ZPchr0006g43304 [Zizania palustris]|uniref:Uncharacterized protein n=1 Tax=Zizania palustris TaxID=103762 RepID=A0A8J5SSP4_ZIZPA|nr:hypothetical protein GUJ93_ZPchr0006g43304 [Zizania palustris]
MWRCFCAKAYSLTISSRSTTPLRLASASRIASRAFHRANHRLRLRSALQLLPADRPVAVRVELAQPRPELPHRRLPLRQRPVVPRERHGDPLA